MTARKTVESKRVFGIDDMPELEISRDFNYSFRPDWYLFARYRGERIKFIFENDLRNYDTYRAMQEAGATYLPTEEDSAAKFIGAPLKRLHLGRTSIHSVKGTDNE